jgi:hypothetical protein
MWLQRDQPVAPLKRNVIQAGRRVPRLAVALILVLTVAAEAGTQAWYWVHEQRAAKMVPWKVAWPSQQPGFKSVPVAEDAQELLRYNEGGGGSWTSADGRNWNMYFFRWLPGRTAGLFIKNHRPDICLPASGMTQRGGVQYKALTVNGVVLPIRGYVFENGGQQLHVYYCYWDGTVPDPNSMNQENWTARGRLQNVVQGKRDVGTQMLEIAAFGYDDDAAAEAAVREQLAAIVHPG